MGRFWSFLFLMVPILGVAVFVAAASGWPANHWLPVDVSAHGHVIDGLFYFILWLTGIIFVGTSLVLFWVLWTYDAEVTTEPVVFTHGSHTLEVVWSIIPAATLLFIAIYQMPEWYANKLGRPTIDVGGVPTPKPALAEVTGRQFEWRIRYAGKDGLIGTPDDIHVVNDLHVPLQEDVVLEIKAQDVLHSFFLPHLRVKQDVVPGMRQYVWFRATRPGSFDIVCAELCGWGHYKMKGRITIESKEDFDKWLQDTEDHQNTSQFTPAPVEGE